MDLEHEVPTHLEVEDKSFFGLTMSQFVTLVIGLTLAAVLYNYGLFWLPQLARLAISGVIALLIILSVLVRPGGKAISDWLLEHAQFHFGVHLAIFGVHQLRDEAREWQPAAAVDKVKYPKKP